MNEPLELPKKLSLKTPHSLGGSSCAPKCQCLGSQCQGKSLLLCTLEDCGGEGDGGRLDFQPGLSDSYF